ncbi:MAG TPA: hypothetical protein VGM78_05040 [Ilumatobacteraceae bacterium]|jgi:hypothetical protein
MLRLICLVQLEPNGDRDALVAAARQMVADEPRIIRGEVMPGLGLMKEFVDHADYSLVMDFASQQDWSDYIAGSPHMKFDAFARPFLKHVVVTQYELPD